jgi:pimeloyl-ACP methyl ester carboxylesterase
MWYWTAIGMLTVITALLGFSWLHAAYVARRYPPIGDRIGLSSGNLHFVQKGSGTPVVFVHGASSNLREWTSSVFDEVATRHHAIALDRPGHGWSERRISNGHDPRVQAEILHELLRKLGVQRPVLVGHSWAGSLVLAYALQHPEETGGILFLSGVSHTWPGSVGWEYEVAALPVIGEAFAWTMVAAGYRWMASRATQAVFEPDAPPENYLDRAGIALYSRPSAFIANAKDLVHLKPIVTEMADKYTEIRAPTVVLTGDSDSVILTKLHSPPLAEKLPNGQLQYLEGTGHMPHHGRAEDVIKSIDDLVEVCRVPER